MKTHLGPSSQRRKARKAHFTSPSHIKYKLMSSHLSKDLRTKHGVRAMPIRKDDEVIIVRGMYKGNKGKITQVYRKRWCVHVEKISKNKQNGAPYNIPLHPSQMIITKLKLDRDRQTLLKKKSARGGEKKSTSQVD